MNFKLNRATLVSLLLIVLGAAAIGAALLASAVGYGGRADLGAKRTVAMAAGVGLLLLGLFLASPLGRRIISVIRAQPPRDVSLLVVAGWFGLVSATGEIAIRLIQKAWGNHELLAGINIVWMTPLADLLIFESVGLVLFVLARRWPKLGSLRMATFVFAMITYWTWLSLIGVLDRVAIWLLAGGLAFQTARFVGAHRDGFSVITRYMMGWLVTLQVVRGQKAAAEAEAFQPARRHFLASSAVTLAGLAAGAYAWRAIPELRTIAALPPARRNAPNVLFIVLDTVRASSLSVYGYGRPTTPELEKFAKTAVRFERAFSTAPWTLPSHASMFTGRFPHELSTGWSSALDAQYPTLAEVMTKQGYSTAGFIANIDYCSREFGLDRGFSHYEDFPVSVEEIGRNSQLIQEIAQNKRLREFIGNQDSLARKHAAQISGDFLNWLAKQSGQPFFAFLNYYDTHDPYVAPAEFAMRFAPHKTLSGFDFQDIGKPSPQEIRYLNDSYDGCIAYLDYQLGQLFRELERRDILDKTLVIVASDHGEQIGEHGLLQHGNSLYMPLLHVPLLVSFPSQIPAGMSVGDPVSLRNLAATVLDIAGLDSPAHLPGVSLAHYWSNRPAPATRDTSMLLSELEQSWSTWTQGWTGPLKSLVSENMHYIRNYANGHETLYDYVNDPFEQSDLSSSEEGKKMLATLRTTLAKMVAGEQVPG